MKKYRTNGIVYKNIEVIGKYIEYIFNYIANIEHYKNMENIKQPRQIY